MRPFLLWTLSAYFMKYPANTMHRTQIKSDYNMQIGHMTSYEGHRDEVEKVRHTTIKCRFNSI